MYHIAPYYISRVMVEQPVFFIGPLFFCLIAYFGVGLTISAVAFFKFYLIVLL